MTKNKTDGDFEEMQEVIDLFWQTIPPIWHAARGLAHEVALEDSVITLSQFHTLRRIFGGSESVSKLADCMHLNRSNVSRTVDELAQNDLVDRARDPNDRRNVRLTLTKNGRVLIKKLHEKIGREMKEKFSVLSLAELENLRRGLLALQKIALHDSARLHKNQISISQKHQAVLFF